MVFKWLSQQKSCTEYFPKDFTEYISRTFRLLIVDFFQSNDFQRSNREFIKNIFQMTFGEIIVDFKEYFSKDFRSNNPWF